MVLHTKDADSCTLLLQAYSKLAMSLNTLQPLTLAQMSWAMGRLK
jgi:hypothetical protein